MSKKITPEAIAKNMQNANKGTTGTNKQYDQNQGNRGKQLQQSSTTKTETSALKKRSS